MQVRVFLTGVMLSFRRKTRKFSISSQRAERLVPEWDGVKFETGTQNVILRKFIIILYIMYCFIKTWA